MGLFSGIKEAKMSNRSDWATVGHYYARIDKVKVDQNRKRQTGFFIEMTILHCLSGGNDLKGEPVPPHTPGTAVTQAIWGHHVDMFLPNVKAFVSSTVGCKPEEVDEKAVDAIVLEDGSEKAQPLSGTVVEFKGTMTETKAGKPFTVISYRGEVPATVLQATLSADIKKNYFDGGRILDEMVAWELEQAEATA